MPAVTALQKPPVVLILLPSLRHRGRSNYKAVCLRAPLYLSRAGRRRPLGPSVTAMAKAEAQ